MRHTARCSCLVTIVIQTSRAFIESDDSKDNIHVLFAITLGWALEVAIVSPAIHP